KPVIPYFEDRLQQHTNFIELNIRATHFGFPMDELIIQNGFQLSEFYLIYQNAFAKVYLKFEELAKEIYDTIKLFLN
ncbi:25440_t:CDS:2, partial [Racocetra persica]